jgi:voltage-gated potassium channel
MSQLRQFRRPLVLLALTLALGVGGYSVIEGWSFLDALYMTVITITTVGFGEVHPLSSSGKIFTMLLVVVGVGVVLYTLTDLFEWLLATDWQQERRKREMEKVLARLRDHFIICGYGRVGRRVAEVFRNEKIPFVVVDVSQASLELAEEQGAPTVLGDAASDEVLRRAGIERAKGLITALDADAGNVYVVLSARGLRPDPDLLIVARSASDEAVQKLQRAGATHVLSPYSIAGHRMAMLAVKPTAVEVVETLLHAGGEDLMLEEVVITPGSRLAGTAVGELRSQASGGPIIVAIRHDNALTPSPHDGYRLAVNDRLVVIGKAGQLRVIENMV